MAAPYGPQTNAPRLAAMTVGLLALAAGGLRAETLPIRVYTSVDGIPRNGIQRVGADSSGFIWALTPQGLSRFDGYGFVSFGADDGQPPATPTDLLETRSGTLWRPRLVSTGSIAKPPRPVFVPCRSESGEAVGRVSAPARRQPRRALGGTSDAGFYRFQERATGCVMTLDRAVSAAMPPFGGLVCLARVSAGEGVT